MRSPLRLAGNHTNPFHFHNSLDAGNLHGTPHPGLPLKMFRLGESRCGNVNMDA